MIEFLERIKSVSGKRMPVLFIGHGNPMNAISANRYRQEWITLGHKMIEPKAVLCISAHWLTHGTWVTMVDKPRTIHDFGGFPELLYQQQYPAPGAVEYAKLASQSVSLVKIQPDYQWGLDHGAWSVLMNMYPDANIPVFQLSIDYSKPAEFHYFLGKELSFLRDKGVLIIASGNVVHNLPLVKWTGDTSPFSWAVEFDDFVKKSIEDNNPKALLEYEKLGDVSVLAHPSNDHLLPLMYVLGLRAKDEQHCFFNDSFDMGSISMRSVIFG
jgi:4,5-DOPA dioxygenase extradiol